jgi:hypothetical protein
MSWRFSGDGRNNSPPSGNKKTAFGKVKAAILLNRGSSGGVAFFESNINDLLDSLIKEENNSKGGEENPHDGKDD